MWTEAQQCICIFKYLHFIVHTTPHENSFQMYPLRRASSKGCFHLNVDRNPKLCIFQFILINVDIGGDAWKLFIWRNIQLYFLCFLWAVVPVRWSHAAAAVGPLSGPSSARCCPDPPSTVWSRRWKYRYNWLHLCDLGTAYRGRHKDITWLQEEEHGLSHQQESVDTWRASGCAGPRPRCFRHCSRRSRPCCLDWWPERSRQEPRTSIRPWCVEWAWPSPRLTACWPRPRLSKSAHLEGACMTGCSCLDSDWTKE